MVTVGSPDLTERCRYAGMAAAKAVTELKHGHRGVWRGPEQRNFGGLEEGLVNHSVPLDEERSDGGVLLEELLPSL